MSAAWGVRHYDRPAAHPRAQRPLRVILDNIRSAYNVGAILRTCEAAGVEHIHLCGISATPANPKVLKTALHAEHMLPWSHHISALEVIDQLRSAGWACYAVELTARSRPYDAVRYPPRTALLFGHEVAGVAEPLLRKMDAVVEIPMQGRKNSLNVATSVGVVVFEVSRQWRQVVG